LLRFSNELVIFYTMIYWMNQWILHPRTVKASWYQLLEFETKRREKRIEKLREKWRERLMIVIDKRSYNWYL
jgi:hypothetical protein